MKTEKHLPKHNSITSKVSGDKYCLEELIKALHVNSIAPPTLQVLNNPPQAVSMGSDEHPLSLFDLRGDLLVPVGQRPCDGVLKALAGRKLVLGQVCIATILQGRQSQYVKYIIEQNRDGKKILGHFVFNLLP